MQINRGSVLTCSKEAALIKSALHFYSLFLADDQVHSYVSPPARTPTQLPHNWHCTSAKRCSIRHLRLQAARNTVSTCRLDGTRRPALGHEARAVSRLLPYVSSVTGSMDACDELIISQCRSALLGSHLGHNSQPSSEGRTQQVSMK